MTSTLLNVHVHAVVDSHVVVTFPLMKPSSNSENVILKPWTGYDLGENIKSSGMQQLLCAKLHQYTQLLWLMSEGHVAAVSHIIPKNPRGNMLYILRF